MAVIEYMNVVLGMNHAKFDQGIDRSIKKINAFSLDVGKLGKAAGIVGLGAGLVGIAKASVELAADAEQAGVAFEVLTGSADKAAKMISDLRKLDQSSPLGFTDFQQAAKTMIGFGVETSDVTKRLSQLSAISMGNSERMQTLALAFSQTSAAGRLMGQEVLQFVNSGFNPLQQISKITGESMADLKKRMEEGGISVAEVGMAFDAATSKGGMFFGMNEKISQTMSGQYAKLQGDLKLIGIELGNAIIPALKDAIELAREFLNPQNMGGKGAHAIGDAIRFYSGVLDYQLTGKTDKLEKLVSDFDDRNARIKAESFIHKPTKDEQAKIDARMEQIEKQKNLEKQLEEQRAKEDKAYQDRLDWAAKNLDSLQKELELEKLKKLSIDEQIEARAKSLTYYGHDREQALKMLKEIQQLQDEPKKRDRAKSLVGGDAFDSTIEKLTEAAQLMGQGFITQAQFDRTMMQEASGMASKTDTSRRDTPTAMAGSVEAYKIFLERDQNKAEELQIAKQQRDALEVIKGELKNRGVLGVARR